eukprot:GHVR01117625.1.p1 GENE.GHVR01117625.1~~GHVR01117625.1.p1  ORF type:complete len:221 (+),score=5.79 GHVR01117625.1:43-705(+)
MTNHAMRCDAGFIQKLKYTQESVKSVFSCGRALIDTYKELISGGTGPNDLPPIVVVVYDNSYWAFTGNRRLLIYKLLIKHCDNQEHIFPVIKRELCGWRLEEFLNKKTTKSNGESVIVRGFKNSELNLLISNTVKINNNYRIIREQDEYNRRIVLTNNADRIRRERDERNIREREYNREMSNADRIRRDEKSQDEIDVKFKIFFFASLLFTMLFIMLFRN